MARALRVMARTLRYMERTLRYMERDPRVMARDIGTATRCNGRCNGTERTIYAMNVRSTAIAEA